MSLILRIYAATCYYFSVIPAEERSLYYLRKKDATALADTLKSEFGDKLGDVKHLADSIMFMPSSREYLLEAVIHHLNCSRNYYNATLSMTFGEDQDILEYIMNREKRLNSEKVKEPQLYQSVQEIIYPIKHRNHFLGLLNRQIAVIRLNAMDLRLDYQLKQLANKR